MISTLAGLGTPRIELQPSLAAAIERFASRAVRSLIIDLPLALLMVLSVFAGPRETNPTVAAKVYACLLAITLVVLAGYVLQTELLPVFGCMPLVGAMVIAGIVREEEAQRESRRRIAA